MKANEVSTLLMTRLNAVKKVSRLGIKEGDLKDYLYTIDRINDLSVVDKYVSDRWLVEDYVIPTFLKDMVYPASITITGTRLGEDFCCRPFDDVKSENKYQVVKELNENNVPASFCRLLSPFEFNNITTIILNALRLDDKGVAVDSLRNEVLITEVYKRGSFNGYTMCNGVFYPLPLKINPYIKESLLNVSETDMIELWLNDLLR